MSIPFKKVYLFYNNFKIPNQPNTSNPVAFDCDRIAEIHGMWFPGAKWHGIGLRTVYNPKMELKIEIKLSFDDEP